ncbi:hypothetical protein C8E97_2347 [Saccharothrix australiensis]|uniref:Uncharacterized protein n=1 Tax=Saccharothrix australiensis TaxID=2072 RepID=A0A495W1N0_9PSEU|nr:hypothetical protein C8E97_2347 [Saccharothrix australiensis]
MRAERRVGPPSPTRRPPRPAAGGQVRWECHTSIAGTPASAARFASGTRVNSAGTGPSAATCVSAC